VRCLHAGGVGARDNEYFGEQSNRADEWIMTAAHERASAAVRTSRRDAP
jgi:hypothetical protein